MAPLNIWMEQQAQSSPEWKGSGPGLPCQPPGSPAPAMLHSYIIGSPSRGLKGGRWEAGKSQCQGHVHCPTPLFLSPSQLPLCHRPDRLASRTLLPLHILSLCFSRSFCLHLPLSLPVSLAFSWREAGLATAPKAVEMRVLHLTRRAVLP